MTLKGEIDTIRAALTPDDREAWAALDRLWDELLLTRGEVLISRRKERPCRVCGGLGAIDGFWLGSVKTCPSCHGKGRQ